MFDELVLHGDKILQRSILDEAEAVIMLRLPWYRTLALEIIREIRITIDDVEYASDELRLQVQDELVPISAFKGSRKYSQIKWCNLDTQKVIIPLKKPLTDGAHRVQLYFSYELPYRLPEEENPAFIQYVLTEKTMTYQKGEI